MSDAEYRRFYEELQRSSATGFSDDEVPPEHLEHKAATVGFKWDRFEELGLPERVPAGGSVYEIGAAEGTLLAYLRDRGYRVSGVEPLDRYAEYARSNLDLDVRTGYFGADAAPEQTPDLVIMDNVLEHVPEPGQILRDVRGLLHEGGALLLLVPNVETPEVSNANIGHFTLWSRRALEVALIEAGFSVVGIVPGRPVYRPHEWVVLALAGGSSHDPVPEGPSLWGTRIAWFGSRLVPPERKRQLRTRLGFVYRPIAAAARKRIRRYEPGDTR